MPIVGFNFDKLQAEKIKPLEAPMKVDSGMKILDIKKEEINLGPKKDYMLRFNYEYKVNYNPKQAEIFMAGHLLYADEPKKIDAIFKQWEKEKKFDPEVTQLVMNNVLMRCNIKALLLGQEIGLPPHIRLPMLTQAQKKGKSKENKAENYIG